jgi:hypothetical protein
MNVDKIAIRVAAGNNIKELANIISQYERIEEVMELFTEAIVVNAQRGQEEDDVPEEIVSLQIQQANIIHKALEAVKPQITELGDKIDASHQQWIDSL